LPGNDEIGSNGYSMRLHFASPLIALLLTAPLLGGCLERGNSVMVNGNGDDDDAFCSANNVKQGSSQYIACRKDRDVQRQNADARRDRSQRAIGEYMIDHPSTGQ
jgi:hypothetical protein